MVSIKGFEPREYQRKIADSCVRENTLVVVPTGLGKTKIAILVAVDIINRDKGNILFMTPTRPLAAQIQREFIDHTDVKDIELVTGVISPSKRKELYHSSIVVSTPQTIENDIKNKFIDLSNFSLIVFDEVHRAVKNFAYTGVAKAYKKVKGRMIGLTASPGEDIKKIEDIKNHLGIDHVEIRAEVDKDVKEYVQEKQIDNIKITLPDYYLNIIALLKNSYKKRLDQLEVYGYQKSVRYIRKTDILDFQKYLQRQIKQGNKFAYSGISLTAQLLKISHAIELIETQGLKECYVFLEAFKEETTKAAKSILSDGYVIKAMSAMKDLDVYHPKVDKLKEIIEEQLIDFPETRVIIFAKFRATTKAICEALSNVAKPIELVGQKEGLKQSEQIQRIQDFGSGKYNVMVCTNVGEEGLDIASADVAIFYDQTGTSIRKIQRAGRVGRMQAGRIINLIARGTRDESLYYASNANVKKMQSTLTGMKKNTTLGEFSG